MANEKRQRQDLNRTAKQQELVKAAAKTRRRAQTTRIVSIVAVAVLAVGLLAVFTRGGGDGDTTTTVAAAPEETTTTVAAVKPSGPAPSVTIPAGEPPKTLQIQDLSVGTGAVVESGDQVDAFYTGTSWLTKKRFDENFSSGLALPVTVGAGGVIKGWDEGLVGMREGGRRQLIIPPDKAYGANSPSPDIAANDTLVFVVEIGRVTKRAGAPTTVGGVAPATTAPATTAPATTAPATTSG